jgi:hypothetical protein
MSTRYPAWRTPSGSLDNLSHGDRALESLTGLSHVSRPLAVAQVAGGISGVSDFCLRAGVFVDSPAYGR